MSSLTRVSVLFDEITTYLAVQDLVNVLVCNKWTRERLAPLVPFRRPWFWVYSRECSSNDFKDEEEHMECVRELLQLGSREYMHKTYREYMFRIQIVPYAYRKYAELTYDDGGYERVEIDIDRYKLDLLDQFNEHEATGDECRQMISRVKNAGEITEFDDLQDRVNKQLRKLD